MDVITYPYSNFSYYLLGNGALRNGEVVINKDLLFLCEITTQWTFEGHYNVV